MIGSVSTFFRVERGEQDAYAMVKVAGQIYNSILDREWKGFEGMWIYILFHIQWFVKNLTICCVSRYGGTSRESWGRLPRDVWAQAGGASRQGHLAHKMRWR